jgi:hypothetical protein
MKLFDATQPIAFPKQVIVLNNDLADRHGDQGFYRCMQASAVLVEVVGVDGEATLAGARNAAVKLGYLPTCWIDTRIGVPVLFD